MIQFLSTVVLAFIFMPGVLYKIPKGYPLIVIAGIHAVLFAIVYMLMQKYVFGNYVEGMAPAADGKVNEITIPAGMSNDDALKEMEKLSTPDKEGNDENDEKITAVLSKLSVETTKELSKLSAERMTALVKIINAMDLDKMDMFVEMPIDKIIELIDKSLK